MKTERLCINRGKKKNKKKQMQRILNEIHTVRGTCPECEEDTILVAIVTDYYRCTTCGHDTRQYVNGSIKYIKLQEDEIEWLKNQSSE
jgi:ribosomal protein S27E